MFWGMMCEKGKTYFQKLKAPLHISMAALKSQIPKGKPVSLQLLYDNKEYLICTLENDRIPQVNLDLNFSAGEEISFLIYGEGTVSLTGYEKPVSSENGLTASIPNLSQVSNVDSDDEEDEDWSPEAEMAKAKGSDAVSNELMEESVEGSSDSDEEEEDSEGNEEDSEGDEEDSEGGSETDDELISEAPVSTDGKRKKIFSMSNSKKAKQSFPISDAKKAKPSFSISEEKKPQQNKKTVHSCAVANLDYDSSEVDEMSTSIGRTPLPKGQSEDAKAAKGMNKKSTAQARQVKNPDFAKKTNAGEKENSLSEETSKKSKVATTTVNDLQKGKMVANVPTRKIAGGIEIQDLKIGNGPIAKHGKVAHVLYEGRLENNEIFDVKEGRSRPLPFRIGNNDVIKGLDLGVEGMRVGGKRKIKIPPSMGYGKKEMGPIPGNSTLYFTIELKNLS